MRAETRKAEGGRRNRQTRKAEGGTRKAEGESRKGAACGWPVLGGAISPKSFPFHLPPSAFRLSAFTLAEVMVAMAIGTVVCAMSMYGILFLQKSYAATEQYALSMTDQMRVLDYLSMDLRRAVAVTVDNTNNNLTMTLPSYYTYSGATDPNHVNPQPVLPVVSADAQSAVYSPGTGPGTATPGVWYRFEDADQIAPPPRVFHRRHGYRLADHRLADQGFSADRAGPRQPAEVHGDGDLHPGFPNAGHAGQQRHHPEQHHLPAQPAFGSARHGAALRRRKGFTRRREAAKAESETRDRKAIPNINFMNYQITPTRRVPPGLCLLTSWLRGFA